MSTRANVIIQETINLSAYMRPNRVDKLYFYRHSDGYPEGVMPILEKFIKWIKEDKIRDNLSQAAGWLVVLGAIEYNTIPAFKKEEPSYKGAKAYGDVESIEFPDDWKVGAFEPTTGIHGDIQHLYVVELSNKTVIEVPREDWDKYGEID